MSRTIIDTSLLKIYCGFQAPVFATTTSVTSVTSNSYTNTNLAASITPTSSSHRIKITLSGALETALTTDAAKLSIKRGSTEVTSGGALAVLRSPAASSDRVTVSVVYVDSPATTSSTTYTVCILSSDNTNTVRFPSNDGDTACILLEEIV